MNDLMTLALFLIVLGMLLSLPRRRKTSLRGAKLDSRVRWGAGTDASDGFVRLSFKADDVTLYDFELTVGGFVRHAKELREAADEISRLAAAES